MWNKYSSKDFTKKKVLSDSNSFLNLDITFNKIEQK